MSREEEQSLPPDWMEQKLAELRRQIASGQWTKLAARLMADLEQMGSGPEDEAGNEDMLTIAVNDAFEGMDVSKRYPQFFQEMLANPQLYEDFIEALELLEVDALGALEELPFEPSRDLAFLNRFRSPQPVIKEEVSGRWQALWQGTVEYLQSLFAPFGSATALVRGSRETGGIEPSSLTLVQSDIQIANVTLDVHLNALQPGDAPLELRLSLWVTESDRPQAIAPDQPLRARINWGSYRESVVFDRYGLVSFPTVPWSAIVDEDGVTIGADLHLYLESP